MASFIAAVLGLDFVGQVWLAKCKRNPNNQAREEPAENADQDADQAIKAAIKAVNRSLTSDEQCLLKEFVKYPSSTPKPVLVHGSAKEALERIMQDVESMLRPDEFKGAGDGEGYGALLHGSPGNGKTLVSKVSVMHCSCMVCFS